MSLGNRGRGRGALNLLPTPGSAGGSSGLDGGDSYELMEARVTEVVDVDSFWAQIGTASDLEKFDQLCVTLSSWCREQGVGLKTVPKVKEVVAVRQQRRKKKKREEEGEEWKETWARALVSRQVSDTEIEVVFIDSGVSGRVGLGEVCSASSPLLYSSPAQALHCFLQGVELLDGEQEWPDEVVSQLSQLVNDPGGVKAIVHKSVGGTYFSVTLYVMYDNSWTSVGEILAGENQAKYSPLAPVYADSLVAAMEDAAVPDTPEQNRPGAAAEVDVAGEVEAKGDTPLLTCIDSHQPTTTSESEEIEFEKEPLPELQSREAVVVKTVDEETAVEKEDGAGDHGKGDIAGDHGKEDRAGDYGKEDRAGDHGKEDRAGDYGKEDRAGDHGKGDRAGDHGKGDRAGDHGKEEAKEDSGEVAVEEDTPSMIGPVGNELASKTSDSEVSAVSSWEKSEDPPLSVTSTLTSCSGDQRDSGPHTPTSDPPGSGGSETSTPVQENLGKGLEVKGSEVKASGVKALQTSSSKVTSGYNPGDRDESGSTLSSDDDWDESLLPPMQQHYLGSSEATPQTTPQASPLKNDPDAGNRGNTAQNRMHCKRAHLQAQFKALMDDGDEPPEPVRAHSHQNRWPFYKRQEEGREEGLLEGEGGGQWPRRSGHQLRRGGGEGQRFRGGGRGHQRSDHTHSDYEGRIGGMRGVRVRGGRGGRGGGHRQKYHDWVGKRHPNEPLDTNVEQPPPPTSSQQSAEPRVIGGMTSDEMRNEVEWHSWRLKQKTWKMLESLSPSTMHSFEAGVQNLLADSSAQKLVSLPILKGPLMVILTTIISEGVKKPNELDTFVQAVGMLQSVAGANVRQLLQPALEEISRDTCESSTSSSDVKKTRHAFSSFLGRLFIIASYSRDVDYTVAVGFAVRHFLYVWSRCAHGQSPWKSIAHADCFATLCEEIGPPMDSMSRETLDEYFQGVVRDNILSDKLPRSAKEIFLSVALKRASKWEGTSARLPSQQPPLPPTETRVRMVPSFSEEAPPPTANVAHPVPVNVGKNGIQAAGLGGMGIGRGRNILQPFPQQQQPLQQMQQPHMQQAQQPTQQQQQQTRQQIQQQTQQIQQLIQQQTQQQLQQQQLHQQQIQQQQMQQQQIQQQQIQQQQLQQQQQQRMQQQQVQQQVQQQQVQQQQMQQQQVQQQHAVQHQVAHVQPRSAFISPPVGNHPPQYLPLQQPIAEQGPPPSQVVTHEINNQYAQVEEMLESLGFPELLEKFKNAMFKDSVLLECENEQLKTGLKEAGVPTGAVTGIMHYLEKAKRKASERQHSSHSSTPVHHPSTPIQPQPSTPLYPQPSTPLSPCQAPMGTIPSHSDVPLHSPGGVYDILNSPPAVHQPLLPQGTSAYTIPPPQGTSAYTIPPPQGTSAYAIPPSQSTSAYTIPPPQGTSVYTIPPSQGPPSQGMSAYTIPGGGGAYPPVPMATSRAGMTMLLPNEAAPAGRPMMLPGDAPAGRPVLLLSSASSHGPTMAMQLHNGTTNAGGQASGSPLAGKKWGFGTFSCVLCGSQTHRTESCNERNKFFLS